jgi:serine/threonine protein kinase
MFVSHFVTEKYVLNPPQFIHSQGLVHNDIHPENIMLDENGTAIIIDFDGSDVVGGTPLKTGTLGWHPLRRRVSFNHDYYSLALVSRWLRGKYDDKDQPIENPSEDAALDDILNDTEFQLYICAPMGCSFVV